MNRITTRMTRRPPVMPCRLLVFLLWGLATVASALECVPLRKASGGSAAPRYAESLLWEIQGPGAQRGFLFGTIHLGADRVGQPTHAVTTALMDSTQFGMEMVLDLEAMFGVGGAMQLGGDQRLSKIIGKPLFERATTLLAAYGVPREMAESLKPWAVYTTLSLPPQQFSIPLDMLLMTTAQTANKKVFGLETLAEQTAAFENVPMADQKALLREVVCHYEQLQADTNELVAAYAKGDLKALYRLAHQYDSALKDRLMDGLLIKRNRRMADRLHRELEKGRAFVAIGALHLPGSNGVLALLVEKGYRVRPLSAQ